MNVVLDTNVVVSALMSALGNPAKILTLFSDGEIQTYYSHDIMAEYEDVLPRPELKIKSEKIKRFFELLKQTGILIIPSVSTMTLPDESDRVFYDTAKEAGATLITGNTKHYPEEDFILTPSQFLEGIPQYVSKNVTQLIAWVQPEYSTNGGLEKKIKIGVLSADNPPFIICSANSSPTGFEIDLIEAISDQINRNYDIVYTYWDEMFASLNSGIFDIAICMITVTEERERIVDFTIPYIEYDGEHYAIAVAKGNTTLLNTLNDVLQALKDSGKLDEMMHSWFSE